MELGRTGVVSLELRFGDPGETGEAAAELDELGWGALWLPDVAGGDVLADTARLLRSTDRLTVATGVLNLWAHDPAEVAATATSLNRRHPGRFLLGVGVSSPDSAASAGQRFERPVARVARYLDDLDAAPDPGRARELIRASLALSLSMPHYQSNLRRLGFGPDDLAGGGSDRLIDSLIAWGGPDAVAKRIREHHAAGADHVAVHVLTADPKRLPRPEPRMTRGQLRLLPRAPHPREQDPRTHAREGTGSEH